MFIPDKLRAGDNLGNHTATQALNLQANALTGTGASVGTAVGVGVTAQGGLNLGQNTVGNNVYVGYQSGSSNTTGLGNTFSGSRSGRSNTTGSFNTFSGASSGSGNTEGSYNTFSGVQSGSATSTGGSNTFVGFSAGDQNTTGSFNVALGQSAGPTALGLTNTVAIGSNAGVSQSNSVVLGNNANVGIGTSAPAAKLDVNGSLRLAVRVCPVNQSNGSYTLTAADVAYSIFKTQNGNYAPTLVLPPAGTGQAEGQLLTLANAANSVCSVSGINTDNGATVTLASIGDNTGVHIVQYTWLTAANGTGYWMRLQ